MLVWFLGAQLSTQITIPKEDWVMGTSCVFELKGLCQIHEIEQIASFTGGLVHNEGTEGCVSPHLPQANEFTEFSPFTDCHA